MTGDLGYGEVEELLGASALDAVAADERAAVDRHLASCRWCALEVDLHREAATLLVRGSPTPPLAVWQRIARRIAPGAGPTT